MTAPRRIQRQRVRGWRMPENTVSVTRPGRWGNPFRPGGVIPFLPGRTVEDKRHAASLYLGSAPQDTALVAAARARLAGRNLACFCKLCDLHRAAGKPAGTRCPWCDPCHVDTLIRLANGLPVCEEVG